MFRRRTPEPPAEEPAPPQPVPAEDRPAWLAVPDEKPARSQTSVRLTFDEMEPPSWLAPSQPTKREWSPARDRLEAAAELRRHLEQQRQLQRQSSLQAMAAPLRWAISIIQAFIQVISHRDVLELKEIESELAEPVAPPAAQAIPPPPAAQTIPPPPPSAPPAPPRVEQAPPPVAPPPPPPPAPVEWPAEVEEAVARGDVPSAPPAADVEQPAVAPTLPPAPVAPTTPPASVAPTTPPAPVAPTTPPAPVAPTTPPAPLVQAPPPPLPPPPVAPAAPPVEQAPPPVAPPPPPVEQAPPPAPPPPPLVQAPPPVAPPPPPVVEEPPLPPPPAPPPPAPPPPLPPVEPASPTAPPEAGPEPPPLHRAWEHFRLPGGAPETPAEPEVAAEPEEEIYQQPAAAAAEPEAAPQEAPEPAPVEPKPRRPRLRVLLGARGLAAAVMERAGELQTRKDEQRQERDQILRAIRAMSWHGYQSMVADIFRCEGYEVHAAEGPDSDAIDMEVTRGVERMFVNCQLREMEQIPVEPLREMQAIAMRNGANGAFLLTDGSFDAESMAFASDGGLVLIGAETLVDLVVELTLSADDRKKERRRKKRTSKLPRAS